MCTLSLFVPCAFFSSDGKEDCPRTNPEQIQYIIRVADYSCAESAYVFLITSARAMPSVR